MRFLAAADAAVLAACTKIAHGFQRRTGKTTFFIAMMGVFMASLSSFLIIANYFRQILFLKSNGFFAALFASIGIALLFDALRLTEAEESAQSTSEERMAFRWILGESTPCGRVSWILGAALGICIALFFGTSMLDLIAWAFFPAGMAIFSYFVLVIPLRPKKSRAGQQEKMLPLILKPASTARTERRTTI